MGVWTCCLPLHTSSNLPLTPVTGFDTNHHLLRNFAVMHKLSTGSSPSVGNTTPIELDIPGLTESKVGDSSLKSS